MSLSCHAQGQGFSSSLDFARAPLKEKVLVAAEALQLVGSFTVEWITCEPLVLEVAARFKAHARLSATDSQIGATAISRQAVLIHKDPGVLRRRKGVGSLS